MKKNKYLKPIIMGASFLMGLSIISTTILVSCSSYQNVPTQPKNTIFNDKSNVSSDANLSGFLPSEAKEKQDILIGYIFNNSISGKKDKLTIDDIKIIKAIDDDKSGELRIEYSISNYWLFDNFILNTPKTIPVSLSGFKIATEPTTFTNSSKMDVTSNPELSKLSTNQLGSHKSLLKVFLFDNEIGGNKASLNSDNIVINDPLTGGDIVAGTVSFLYEVSKYWSNKGIVEDNNKKFTIELIGFKKVTQNDVILSEINKGGEHQGLTIDKYLPIIESLKLTNQYRLNYLNNSVIEKTLNLNPDYSNLIVEIISANQSNQTLSLSISGTYKGVNIPANEIINVTGFYNSIDSYHPDFSKFKESIYISEIEFNFDSYFKNLQTQNDIKTWDEDKWMSKYLSKLSVLKIPDNQNHISFSMLNYWETKIFENIKFNNVQESIDSQTWKNLSINVDYNNYQYDKNSKTWNKISDFHSKSFNFKAANYLKFNAPSQQNAIDWIAASATVFDVAETSTYYSSYWYSLYEKGDFESINSLITIDETITKKYFFDKQLVVNLDSMSIDDYNGEMNITFKLNYNDYTLESAPVALSTKTFKKLSEFIDANNKAISNTILVPLGEPETSLRKNIIKSIKNEFTKEELNSFVNGNDVNMTSPPILFANTNQFRLFNGYSTNINDKLNLLNESITPHLFNKAISPTTIDRDKNLFIINGPKDNKAKFMIHYIFVNVEKNTKAVLTKNDTSFLYKVPFKYSLAIESNSIQNIEIDSYYYATLLNSDLGL